ncbi:MAG: hypothetical protein V2I54_01240 [Bacteroidales bacterium]|jgi:hypothetical protein|nr:hypothetical protein [Bacteroidales bacterium]
MKHFYLKLVSFTLLLSWLTLPGITQNIAVTDDDSYMADPSAMLDVKSISKGVLVPRLTTSQRTSIVEPAVGLLVFDIDFQNFYFFNGTSWEKVSAEGIWMLNTNSLYLSDNNYRVGIGTSVPRSKLEVKGDASFGEEDTLFVVKDQLGYPVFAVFPDGVKVYVDQTTKGKIGGFAVSGRTSTKFSEENYFYITPDSARIYLNETGKGSLGGFAVSGRTSEKGVLKDYFNISSQISAEVINPSEPRVLWYPNKEAFLVGRVLIEDPDSVGLNSVSTGYESKAIGDWSQAFGYQSVARSSFATAIGKNATANADNAFAFGNSALAHEQNSYAIGSGALAIGVNSFALGSVGIDTAGNIQNSPLAFGNNSFALGLGSRSMGLGSFSIGINNIASADFSTAIGFESVASGNRSIAIGPFASSAGYGSSAIGYRCRTLVDGSFSFSAGLGCETDGYGAVAIGTYNHALGNKSVAMGDGSLASGYASFALGKDAEALAGSDYAMGIYVTADGGGSYAFGKYCTTNAKAGSIVFNTVSTKAGLKPSRNYEMNFKAENGFRFFNTTDTLESGMVIFEPGGNVGLGIKNPVYKLDIDGSINITGNYYSKGVKSNFADYVFSEEYDLKSIEEHAAFMWENKHLPALKSAQELSNTSFSITQRSEQMLEELEIAHIYIEKLNHQLKSLKEENNSLKQKFEYQQQQIDKLILEIEKMKNNNY